MFVIVLWPRSVQLAYGEKTCINQLALFPSLLTSRSDNFRLEPSGHIVIGGMIIASTETCVIPLKAPKVGIYSIEQFIAGIPLLKKTFDVVVPDSPVASVQAIEKPIPVASDLKIELSEADTVFSYAVRFGENLKTECETKQKTVICNLEKLNLEQGKTYSFSLERYFDGQKVGDVLTREITTLRSVKVVKTSIKDKQTVFSKSRGIEIQLDKEIVSANAVLERTDGKNGTVPLDMKINGKAIHISWDKDLDRRTGYRFILWDVVAQDESSLEEKYTLTFMMSGGPKVTNISVRSYGVAVGSTATLSFDQEISSMADITSHIKVTGGAKVSGMSGRYVYINFTGVEPCTRVTITIDDMLKSRYGIVGGSVWSYATRTVCHTVSTIGRSVQGRAINAFLFGNGSKTIVYTGAIHGDEISTYYLMHRWIDALEADYYSIPKNVKVIVIPVINPDGVALGRRTNARNVDLNRNFDTTDWKKNITDVYNRPFKGGGGDSPLSEPESKTIASFIGKIKPSLVVSYHSIGSVVLANPAPKSSYYASTYAAYSGYSYSTSSIETFNYSITGTADDYYWQRLGVASIVVELGSHTHHQFPENQDAMWKMFR